MGTQKIEDVSSQVRDLYNKGFTALERGKLDYAIDLLTRCVEMSPGFLQARRYLRLAEVQRFKSKRGNWFTHLTSSISGNSLYVPAKAMLSAGKFEQALDHAEKLLAADPLNKRFVNLFAEAATKAGMAEAALQTLEIVRESYPRDADVLQWLGTLYMEIGNAKGARECFEVLSEVKPNDPKVLRWLKNATAQESLLTDWSNADDYRSKIKDTKEAEQLEAAEKAVKTERDIETLIAATQAKIEKEPGNVNYYRQLSRLYLQKGLFDEGIQVLQQAIARNPGDPELESALGAARLQQYDHRIATLREAGDAAAADAMQTERDQFAFDDLQQRVTRYPNELKLRYEFGAMLFGLGEVDQAIQQFQYSQRSATYRAQSLYHLGLAFRSKNQYDLAIGQLDQALAEVPTMDELRKSILYELGEIHEIVGNKEQAGHCYKQVYQVDIGYRDVAGKVEQVYKR
jgi:tetratricopeptide (TPR) repeat protein